VNSRERVRLATTCQRPDRIPKSLAFFEQSIPEIAPAAPENYFKLDVRYVAFDPPREQDDFLSYLRGLPADVHVGNLAQLRTYHEWDYHPESGPAQRLTHVQTIEELAEAILPELTDPRRYAGLKARVDALHAEGWAVAGTPPHLGGELFESAYRLRGFQEFLVDLAQRKGLAHYLLDQLTALMVHNSLILTQAGVDVLMLDDDVAMPTGMILSPDTWREFFKPRLADAIRLVRESSPELVVFYHSDGDFTALIGHLAEVGVNVINPIQPDRMDALAIKREFGDRIAMWGTVGSAWLWDRGTPEQIRAEVRHRINTLGPEGLVLAPAYDIDFTPLRNLVAFAEAAEEFGRVQ
jgi:uroporphyrinogen decarboxylase